MSQQFLKVSELAKQLGLSRRFLYEMAQRGEIPHVRIGRTVRIGESDLADYLAACRRGPVAHSRGVTRADS